MSKAPRKSLAVHLKEWREGIDPPVFWGAAILTWGTIAFAGIWTAYAGEVFAVMLERIATLCGWYYVLVMTLFLGFAVWLMLSRFGSIRLGGQDSRPEFGNVAWFSMLFAAGMGMGLVFWGVAEPVYHYLQPPTAEAQSAAAVRESMRFIFFHWGLHPWAVYAIFGIGIAYFHFRHGLPLAPRSLLFPLLGNRIHGWIGYTADAFCTFGTLLGVSTSLGLGAMQINAGFSELTAMPYAPGAQIGIIAAITLVATASTLSGVKRGIKSLSIFNVVLMALMLGFVFIFGPTLFQIKLLLTATGDYFQNLVTTSLWMDLRPGSNWQKSWTLFYWGWWISWCPFVGIFIARISRGRSIREFVFWVLLIPTAVNFLWLSVFGGTALDLILRGDTQLAAVVTEHVAMSMHALLDRLPAQGITQWLAILLAIVFFITSSDSGSFVDDMVTSGGNPHPPLGNRLFWGLSEGAAAAVLLMAGGLKALQSASISAGLPQSALVVAACVSLVIALRRDSRDVAETGPDAIRPRRRDRERAPDPNLCRHHEHRLRNLDR